MAYKVLTNGNGSGLIRVVGLGDYMPLEEHQSMVAERDALAAQLVDAFGDGYYDGFLDGAKHHEQNDCNTDPTYLGEDALHCSEIAETEKASRIGVSKKQQCLAEIKAEAVRDFIYWGTVKLDPEFSEFADCAETFISEGCPTIPKEYAAKVRQGGTWLKDSNVNGGKRQGGE